MPLRVLYLIPTLAPGGAERVVIEHLRRLPRDRFAPELALYHTGGPLQAQVPPDVPVHHLPASVFPRTLARARALRRVIEGRGIDIVSSHIGHANFLNLVSGGRAARVLTMHLDRQRVEFRLEAFLRRQLQRRLCRRAGRVVFLCRSTAEATAREYGARPDQVAVIPNGVDPEESLTLALRDPPPAWPPGAIRLLAAGRLRPQKGFDILLRALAIARGRGLDASLLILGEGGERHPLERLREALGLGAVVDLRGHAPNPHPAMRHADIFVLPSRYEGFPLVLLEALALGRPVVAADCPSGPAEILAAGAGVLVPPNEPEALAAALHELARDPARRADLARRAADRAAEYRWTSVIDRTAAMLEETVRGG